MLGLMSSNITMNIILSPHFLQLFLQTEVMEIMEYVYWRGLRFFFNMYIVKEYFFSFLVGISVINSEAVVGCCFLLHVCSIK